MLKSPRHKQLEWCNKVWFLTGAILLILTGYMIYQVGFFNTQAIIMYGICCLWYCTGILISFIDVLSRDPDLVDSKEKDYQKK